MNASLKIQQKKDFDRRHSAKTLPEILPGERVWLPDQKAGGSVVERACTPTVLHSGDPDWPDEKK